MVQSPSWEANWFAASQEIPRISRNPKVHYRAHKRPPPVSILGQPNPIHIPTSHLLEIHPNIIHPSTPRSPQWSPSLRFPHQDPIHPLSSPIRATCPALLILLDFITRAVLGEEYKSFSSSLCNLLHSLVTSSLLSRYLSCSPRRMAVPENVGKMDCKETSVNNYERNDASNPRTVETFFWPVLSSMGMINWGRWKLHSVGEWHLKDSCALLGHREAGNW